LNKWLIRSKKMLTIASLTTLLLLATLALAVGTMMPMAKAQPTMTINPTYGPPGTYVTCYGFGFSTNSQVTLSIFTTSLGSLESTCDYGDIATQIQIPGNTPVGSYPITATDQSGNTVSATFTVTEGSAPPPATPTPSSGSATPAPTQVIAPVGTPWTYTIVPTTQTGTSKGGSSLSTMWIVIIVVVIVAVLVPLTMMYRRRGSGASLVEESPPAYQPGPTAPAGVAAGSYGSQVARPSVATAGIGASRYPTSSYSQQLGRPTMTARPTVPGYGGMSSTRMCPGCHRPVKDYYSVCPYCHRKIK